MRQLSFWLAIVGVAWAAGQIAPERDPNPNPLAAFDAIYKPGGTHDCK